MESSHWGLLNDIAEHRSILENYQNTHYPRFSFTHPKQVGLQHSLKWVFCFYCEQLFGPIARSSS